MTKKQITFLADEATIAELDYLARLKATSRSEILRFMISRDYKLDKLDLMERLPANLREQLSSEDYDRTLTTLINTPPAQFLTYRGLTGKEAVRAWQIDHPDLCGEITLNGQQAIEYLETNYSTDPYIQRLVANLDM